MKDEIRLSALEVVAVILVIVFLANTFYNNGFDAGKNKFGKPGTKLTTDQPYLSTEEVSPWSSIMPHKKKLIAPAATSTIPAVISYAESKVLAVSVPVFAYAHGTVMADGKIFIGMANRPGNRFPTNQLVVFSDLVNLVDHRFIKLPRSGDIETMVYDDKNDKVYFALSSNGGLELYSVDPHTLAVSVLISTTTVDLGRRPAIVTDGRNIYGITETEPSAVFSFDLFSGKLMINNSGHVSMGHSAALAQVGSSTELYFGGGMSDIFEKVDAETLEVISRINLSPCGMTDDMPYAKVGGRLEESVGYVYVGCEQVPNGIRISTKDMKAERFILPGESYGMYVYGSNLYSVALDGNIDVFKDFDIRNLKRHAIVGAPSVTAAVGDILRDIEPNELLFSPSTGSMYFTAWWGIPGLFRVQAI